MSMASTLIDLRRAAVTLEQSIAELVMITHEDRPAASEIAIVDGLGETVSELQADAVLATQRLAAIARPRDLPDHLAPVGDAIGSCTTTYWRDLRSFAVVHELRRTASTRGAEWRAWQRSIELSLLRCEQPVQQAAAAVTAAWHEVGELLAHCLSAPAEPVHPITTDEHAPTSIRRTS